MCVQMCYASNRNIPSFTGWGEWRLTSGDHKHWLIQPSFFFWGGEGVTWRRDPSQVPQNWKLRGFRPLFLGRSQNLLSKKWRNVRFATGKGGPQNQQKMTEVYFFDVEEKCAFVYVFQLVLNRLWMRKHPISGRFWNSEDNFENLNFRKR